MCLCVYTGQASEGWATVTVETICRVTVSPGKLEAQTGLANVAEGERRPQLWGKFVRHCYSGDLTRTRGTQSPALPPSATR